MCLLVLQDYMATFQGRGFSSPRQCAPVQGEMKLLLMYLQIYHHVAKPTVSQPCPCRDAEHTAQEQPTGLSACILREKLTTDSLTVLHLKVKLMCF